MDNLTSPRVDISQPTSNLADDPRAMAKFMLMHHVLLLAIVKDLQTVKAAIDALDARITALETP